MITKPAMPTAGSSLITPVIRTTMPTTKTGARGDRAAAGGAAQGGAAQRGGELGVLLHEGALHLLEQSQLFLGERHRASSRSVGVVKTTITHEPGVSQV